MGKAMLMAGMCIYLLAPARLHADTREAPSDTPSLQLLEFLADFGDMDTETWELIEYHAIQDSESGGQEKTDEND